MQKQAVVKTSPSQDQSVSRIFLVTKRRFLSSGDKPKATQPFCSEVSLQDGGDWDVERSTTSIRLDVFHRSERCVPISEHLPGTPTIPPLHMDGEHIRVHLLALRTDQHSKDLYQTTETCERGQGLRTIIYLHGRSVDNEPVPSNATISSEPDSVTPGVARLHYQQGEIPASALPADQISGIPGGLCGNEAFSP